MVFLILLLTIALASPIAAQAPAGTISAALIPAPLWPRDGDTSRLPKGQYVFYDPPAGEYVVYYSPDSGNTTSTQPTVLRFGTHALVAPNVMSKVSPTGDGTFHYTYDISNGAHARQSIQKVRLVTFSDSSPKASRLNWTANVTQHNERDLATPTTGGAVIDWTSNNATLSVAPGSTTEGFAVDSKSLPGFINMTFQGSSQSSQYSSDVVASLPKEVRDQLARVFNTAWDMKSSMVIGPRFAKGTSQSIITQNYFFGLQMLVLHRELDRNSPFVQRAWQLLNDQLQSQDQTHLTAANLDFISEAKPGLETVIANALEIALAQ